MLRNVNIELFWGDLAKYAHFLRICRQVVMSFKICDF